MWMLSAFLYTQQQKMLKKQKRREKEEAVIIIIHQRVMITSVDQPTDRPTDSVKC